MSDSDKLLQILMNWRDEKVERLRAELADSQKANAELRRELDEAKPILDYLPTLMSSLSSRIGKGGILLPVEIAYSHMQDLLKSTATKQDIRPMMTVTDIASGIKVTSYLDEDDTKREG